MKYDEIYPIACRVVEMLRPYSDRIEIAGSIRRKCQACGDIEIVWMPSKHGQWSAYELINLWHKVKGEASGKYTQRILNEGVKLDLFRATSRNWGLIYGIRTGSAEFSHRVLACGWVKAGYTSQDGFLWRKGSNFEPSILVDVPEEIDLFNLIGVKYLEPEFRY